jgi:hypothetical protein
MKVPPGFEICRVNTPHLKGFNRAGYLVCPELVQFHVTLPNLSLYRVHFAEQGLVL